MVTLLYGMYNKFTNKLVVYRDGVKNVFVFAYLYLNFAYLYVTF